MSDELARLRAELEEVEQALAASADLPAAQREVILAALRAQRDTLQSQITTLSGSGALAQDHSVAAGEMGVAVGRDVQGDVIIVTDPDLLWRDIRRRPTEVEHPPGHGYSIGAIRNLLREAFTAGDLRRFCHDRPAFQPILDHFGPKYSFEEMIETVVEWCERREMLPDLLAEVQQVNPRQYRRNAATLRAPAAAPAKAAEPPPPSRDLRQATGRYLEHLVDRYRYLEFRGMGISDKVALRLPLVEMYVPLKARIELPEGETWARSLHLAGRKPSEEEAEAMGRRLSEPQPALELLREHAGLVVLGDPGAGVRPASCWYECLPQAVTVASP